MKNSLWLLESSYCMWLLELSHPWPASVPLKTDRGRSLQMLRSY